METLKTVEQQKVDSGDDDLDHYVCECNLKFALCGRDVSDIPITALADPTILCVVCKDLMNEVCKFCNRYGVY